MLAFQPQIRAAKVALVRRKSADGQQHVAPNHQQCAGYARHVADDAVSEHVRPPIAPLPRLMADRAAGDVHRIPGVTEAITVIQQRRADAANVRALGVLHEFADPIGIQRAQSGTQKQHRVAVRPADEVIDR